MTRNMGEERHSEITGNVGGDSGNNGHSATEILNTDISANNSPATRNQQNVTLSTGLVDEMIIPVIANNNDASGNGGVGGGQEED